MFKTYNKKNKKAKCALKAKGDDHFRRDYCQARQEMNRQGFLGISVYAARYGGDALEMLIAIVVACVSLRGLI